jgi:group I intron endonuclease
MIGIYRIRNTKNDKCYYGSSKDVEKRWLKHKNSLLKNNHYNTILQRAWNRYGEDSFVFEIVQLCEKCELLEIEQKYLNFNPEYNIGSKSSGGDNITKNPNKDTIIKNIVDSIKLRYSLMTDEDKKKMYSKPLEKNPNWKGGISKNLCLCGKLISPINKTCDKCRNRSGSNNSFFGKKHSEENKNKQREKMLGKKPTNMKKVSIDGILYESLAEATRQTGIPSPTILWRIKSKNKKYENYQKHEKTTINTANHLLNKLHKSNGQTVRCTEEISKMHSSTYNISAS